MAFITDRKQQNTNRAFSSVSRFMKLEEGKPALVQILDSTAKEYFKFWFRDSTGRWVAYASPGYDVCPLTQRNRGLGSKDHPDYIRPQYTYAVNVLDVTPYKKCPECANSFYPTDAPATCECGKGLADIKPEPLNMVRILERGKRLFSQLRTLDQGTPILNEAGEPSYDDNGEQLFQPIVFDSTGNPLSITEYVVQIVRTGAGTATVTTPVPMLHIPASDPKGYVNDLYELPQSMDLTPEEVLSIVDSRVPLADILAARRADADAEETTKVESTEDSLF